MSAPAPLRFCLLTTFYPPYHFGGDGVYVHRLAQALATRGHRVTVIHSVDAYRLRARSEPAVAFGNHENVTVHGLRSKSGALAALLAHQSGAPALYGKRLRAILAAPFDVIHFHNVSLLGGPGVLALGRGVKLYTAHEYWLVCPTHVLFRLGREACTRKTCLSCTLASGRPPQLWRSTGALRRAARTVDAFLMPSRFALERHRADGFDAPMEWLPCFVPAQSGVTAATPAASARPYFLCVGRLERLKGMHELIALFREYAAADLVIAGSGSEEEELRRASEGLPHIRFVGQLYPDALHALYAGAIAVLAPSLCYETFGLTVAEALFHGTPAIVRDIGALGEIVRETGGGLSFRTLPECREACERLRTDAALRSELAARGRAAAERLYSENAHVTRYLGIVEAIRSRERQEPVAAAV